MPELKIFKQCGQNQDYEADHNQPESKASEETCQLADDTKNTNN